MGRRGARGKAGAAMKFEARYFPEKGVSRDAGRAHLTHVHLDTKAKKLVATDGHMMVVIPCEVEKGDSDGPVSVVAIEFARRGKRAVKIACSEDWLTCEGARFDRPILEAQFPPWQEVMPDYKAGQKNTITFGFDATLLRETAVATGVSRDAKVKVTLPTTKAGAMLDPFVITPEADGDEKAFAILMPVRVVV